MKVLLAVSLLAAFCFAGLSYGSVPDEPENRERFGLLKMVEYCDLVVKGTVTRIDYVVREGVLANGRGALTTDITITVEETLKGSPNASENTVKFMILGGRGVHPRTGKRVRMEMSNQPEFAVDEDVVVFLKQADADSRGSFARNFAHDRHYVVGGKYGKRAIENENVNMLYGDVNNALTPVEMPVDLAIKLGKASLRDKPGATVLENVIRGLANAQSEGGVTLSSDTIDDLKQKAQRIIDTPCAD